MTNNQFISVYGPVPSWRYGQSLGIDPIGKVSTCSFNCVYCQLGKIEVSTNRRQIFVPTQQIIDDLQQFKPWDVDIITISGSGEPTLAANLGEIITNTQEITQKPVCVLTNATLLEELKVRQELALADEVSVKLDAVFPEQLQRINHPIFGINLLGIEAGIKQFRQIYSGKMAIQTMLIVPWQETKRHTYIELIKEIKPDEIQINIPSRPKPLVHQIEHRGDHRDAQSRPYRVHSFKTVNQEYLEKFAQEITAKTGILVRYPHLTISEKDDVSE